ncbi:aldehyde dehydrogenase (NADP(+)) [Brevibacterium marinum]|uniref:NADP-dependent aldehyde dehydrogenase n=1 Tax=Brevibacterium marinum TaxID=418643 RepID=A0A846S3C4_9MICO|nr:aldehyde dehydrogenase (NADP(+)) [Brevibacterium marinum]NJC55367.1 NADP-dependent aldehyde dehydrogenase [Brevibacterium marinum]
MTTTLTGASIIAGEAVEGINGTTRAIDPSTNTPLEPEYSKLDSTQAQQATAAAAAAFRDYRATTPQARAAFLDAIAATIEGRREQIVERAMAETGLPSARLTGEVGRTVGQLRLFAGVVREGNFHGARIDPALPDRSPGPRLDIRQRRVPLGPVLVFGASNFPLAFSVAGGDTAAALAAGCPVVVKAHNAHPGTGELVGQAITEAAAESGMPAGVFSLVYGSGAEIGQQLASDPVISAIGFTGSRSGGLALADTAASREVPIPMYAEMSSINPVILLDGALSSEGVGAQGLAEQFVGSLTGSSGQLCTAPGLVFVPEGEDGDAFVTAVESGLEGRPGQTMLTPGIADAFAQGVSAVEDQQAVATVARGVAGEGENAPAPVVFSADLAELRSNSVLSDEVFGSASVIIRYSDIGSLSEALDELEGQLTVTVHAVDADTPAAEALLPTLEDLAGRILFNGWPTGVEVGHAMVHGGPFPATTAPATTSVGSLAIERFLRPVAYQAVPAVLMPEPLQDANPWSLVRQNDGVIAKGQ